MLNKKEGLLSVCHRKKTAHNLMLFTGHYHIVAIAVITCIASGYVISSDVNVMDVIADVMFTTILDAAYAAHGVLSLSATSRITDDGTNTDNLELNGARTITTFESGGHTYAVVAGHSDDGVQILNVTDPSSITAAGRITEGGTRVLNGVDGIAIFESGDHTYAAVTSSVEDGVQILNITRPSSITAAGSIIEDDTRLLNGASGIAIFESGGHTYAAVTAYSEDGVQILNITSPSSITAAGSIKDDGTNTDDLELNGAYAITIFESGNHTYAAVAAYVDDGVQILNITSPSNITAAGSITDDGTNTDNLELNGVYGITTFVSGGHTYAVVAAYLDDGVQILNVTDPSSITAAGRITNGDSLVLNGVAGIATFESGGHTYVAVAASVDDGVQILDVTDPPSITAVGNITDDGTNTDDLELNSAWGITTFESGSHTYVAVAANRDDGVQIIRVDISDATPPVITLEGPSTVTITVGVMYADEGATCTDGVDGDITPTSSSNVNANQVGTYMVTYSCTDAAGNQATVSRTVIVESAPDTTPPVIDLEGPSTVTITVGVMYADEGATCTDGVDGDITPTSSSNVNANQVGTYMVTYSCTDAAGNQATVSRTVIVESAPDTTPPVIDLEGPSTVTITVGVMYADEGATCTDGVDGDITPTSSSNVNANQVGTYMVTYSCTDAAGNQATVSRTVIVESAPDTTPPVIDLEGPSTVTITVGIMYADEGATCTDGVDGDITPTSSSNVNANQVGTYMVTYSCTDAAGNQAEKIRIVTVKTHLVKTGSDSKTWTVNEFVRIMGGKGQHDLELISRCDEGTTPIGASTELHLLGLLGQASYGTSNVDMESTWVWIIEAYRLASHSLDTGKDTITEDPIPEGLEGYGITLDQYIDAAPGDTFEYPDGNYTKAQLGSMTAWSASIDWTGDGSCSLDFRQETWAP